MLVFILFFVLPASLHLKRLKIKYIEWQYIPALDRDKVVVENVKCIKFVQSGGDFAIVGIDKSEICRADWQAEDSGKNWCCSSEYKGWKSRQNFCSVGKIGFWGNCFLLLRPSTDWMRLTHIMEGNLLTLKSTDCKY